MIYYKSWLCHSRALTNLKYYDAMMLCVKRNVLVECQESDEPLGAFSVVAQSILSHGDAKTGIVLQSILTGF